MTSSPSLTTAPSLFLGRAGLGGRFAARPQGALGTGGTINWGIFKRHFWGELLRHPQINDGTHGQQFKARFLKTSAPTSVEGIEKYLASGMIPGIGPVYAKKLLRAFGDKVFDVIEAQPDRL